MTEGNAKAYRSAYPLGLLAFSLQVFDDTILGLEAIAGNGQQIVCDSTQETELFNSLLGGLGRFGVVTQVTLPLISAPTNLKLL